MLTIFHKQPKIKIRYNEMLDEIFLVYVKNAPQYKESSWTNWAPWPKEKFMNNIRLSKVEWKKYESIILKAMTKTLDLQFRNKEIDVHVVSANPRDMGTPIIVRGTSTPEKFVTTLTHELIHQLLRNNRNKITPEKIAKYFKKLVPGESYLTYNHIIVYAVIQYIFEDVLKKPEWYKLAKNNAEKYQEYKRALEIIDNLGGYKKVLKLK